MDILSITTIVSVSVMIVIAAVIISERMKKLEATIKSLQEHMAWIQVQASIRGAEDIAERARIALDDK
jgi:uncharacterized protein YoxC